MGSSLLKVSVIFRDLICGGVRWVWLRSDGILCYLKFLFGRDTVSGFFQIGIPIAVIYESQDKSF